MRGWFRPGIADRDSDDGSNKEEDHRHSRHLALLSRQDHRKNLLDKLTSKEPAHHASESVTICSLPPACCAIRLERTDVFISHG